MKRSWMFICLVPFLLLAVPLWAEERPSDELVTAWVKGALREDSRVESSQVVVKTNDGIVTLSGDVRNLPEMQFAERETAKIKGVRGVINELSVTPSFRYDADIERDVGWRLFDSPEVNLHKLNVDVTDGVVTLKGTVESWSERNEAGLLASEVRGVRQVKNDITIKYLSSRPDEAIREDIRTTMQRDVYLVGLPITATVRDGNVTLSGTVGNAYERQRATVDAWVSNVKSVDNDLTLEPWENRGVRSNPHPSDAEIRNALKDELSTDLRIASPFDIDVACRYGNVTLRGTVPSYDQKQLAAKDAKDVVGVAWVTNYLVVKTPRRADQAIRRDIESRFDTDYLLEGQDIRIDVDNGIVTLSGSTNSYPERSHAVEVASRVPGVLDVRDNVHVNLFLQHTDARLAERIKDRLREHAGTRWVADRIHVTVKDAMARLTGEVFTWSERKEAGEIAFATDGVRGVDNAIAVEGVSYPWDEETTIHVEP